MPLNVVLAAIEIELVLPEVVSLTTALWLGAIAFSVLVLVVGFSSRQLPKLIDVAVGALASEDARQIYRDVVLPERNWLAWTIALSSADLAVLTLPAPRWLGLLEFPLGLALAIDVTLLAWALFTRFFDEYLLSIALQDDVKVNSELLALGNFLARAAIVLVVIFIFAQMHRIDLLGLVASLGIGGIAVAFASQRILEQILWSVVLYVDRPFTVDDYIHLPDGILGRVEGIGWRSTKIRLSGKNTLVVAPNSNLAQVNIENMTRARRVISIVNLTFLRAMSDEEKALIQQLIVGSTNDILGIDRRLTQVNFQDLEEAGGGNHRVHAQVIFYILGAAEDSMELRRNLLEIARENIIDRLYTYGINFEFEQETVDIAQPMNI